MLAWQVEGWEWAPRAFFSSCRPVDQGGDPCPLSTLVRMKTSMDSLFAFVHQVRVVLVLQQVSEFLICGWLVKHSSKQEARVSAVPYGPHELPWPTHPSFALT